MILMLVASGLALANVEGAICLTYRGIRVTQGLEIQRALHIKGAPQEKFEHPRVVKLTESSFSATWTSREGASAQVTGRIVDNKLVEDFDLKWAGKGSARFGLGNWVDGLVFDKMPTSAEGQNKGAVKLTGGELAMLASSNTLSLVSLQGQHGASQLPGWWVGQKAIEMKPGQSIHGSMSLEIMDGAHSMMMRNIKLDGWHRDKKVFCPTANQTEGGWMLGQGVRVNVGGWDILVNDPASFESLIESGPRIGEIELELPPVPRQVAILVGCTLPASKGDPVATFDFDIGGDQAPKHYVAHYLDDVISARYARPALKVPYKNGMTLLVYQAPLQSKSVTIKQLLPVGFKIFGASVK